MRGSGGRGNPRGVCLKLLISSSPHLLFPFGLYGIFSIIFAMRIHVLALDGVFDLGLSAVLDAFQTANELAEMSGFSGERFDVKIVGVNKSIKTSQGLTVPVQLIG